jgi:uncharacterized protein (TIGR03437 family)
LQHLEITSSFLLSARMENQEMKRTITVLSLAVALSAGAHAATTSTNLTVNATTTFGASGIAATGTATLSGIGNGPFSATLPLSELGAAATAKATFTITLSGGTLTGNLLIPVALLTSGGTQGGGSAVITGGTGTYAGATGSFPALAGTATGSLTAGFTFTFTGAGTITTGGTDPGPGPGTPTVVITDVLDAGGYTKNIAQGSVFVVKGTNLAPSGLNQYSFPLPATANGVKITFTPASGGTGVDAFLVYTCNTTVYGCVGDKTQLAAVLPSSLAAGNYNVTVTNGTAVSAAFAAAVVQRKFGLITQSSDGSGLVTVQNYISPTQLDINRYTTGNVGGYTVSPARPGQVLIAWGTGMGPVTGGDNTASPGFDFNANGVTIRILVGGVSITPLYAGRTPGLAGTDQINFQLPSNVPTGCTVPFQVSVNGVLSNPTFISIAPANSASACVSETFSQDQLRKFDQGGTYTVGSFGLYSVASTVPGTGTVKSNLIGGGFVQYSGFQLDSASQSQNAVSGAGSCYVFHDTDQNVATSGGSGKSLDAGAVTLSGPAGSNISSLALTRDAKLGSYYLSLGIEGISIPGQVSASIVPGTYALSGAGGADVGRFNASITLGAPLTITGGLPASVTRGAGLTLNWTGGNASDLVQITGSASMTTGAVSDTTSFVCTTTAGQRTFTVPASILNQLPAVSASSSSSSGSLGVYSFVAPGGAIGLFTAPLTAGGSIDAGFFLALTGAGASVSYQ